jgi:predicted ester cyclase
MSPEANKAVVRRLFDEVLNTGNFAPLDELFAAHYVNYLPGAPVPLDRQGWEQNHTRLRTALPDVQFTIEQLLAEGDMVVTRFTARGTHQGAFLGIPPTGRPVTIVCQVFGRFANGQIVEDRPVFDRLDLLQQLGVVPAEGQGMQERAGEPASPYATQSIPGCPASPRHRSADPGR